MRVGYTLLTQKKDNAFPHNPKQGSSAHPITLHKRVGFVLVLCILKEGDSLFVIVHDSHQDQVFRIRQSTVPVRNPDYVKRYEGITPKSSIPNHPWFRRFRKFLFRDNLTPEILGNILNRQSNRRGFGRWKLRGSLRKRFFRLDFRFRFRMRYLDG